LLNDTVIIITADHGENICEKIWLIGHAHLYESVIKVPLLIYLPHFDIQKRIKSLVSHIDILPTLLSYLKIKPPYEFDGIDMTPLIDGKVATIREYVFFQTRKYEDRVGLRKGEFKYIRKMGPETKCKRCGRKHLEEIELYHLSSDPAEENNLAFQRPDLKNEMEGLLNLILKEVSKRRKQLMELPLNKQPSDSLETGEEEVIKQRLRQLGYFD
jgi:arylsulfatase A-like enzyme